jgi:hypothetical protein
MSRDPRELPIIFLPWQATAAAQGRARETRRPVYKHSPSYRLGDLLWVRETFWLLAAPVGSSVPAQHPRGPVAGDAQIIAWHHGAPDPRVGWQERDRHRINALFMPRWAARLILRVVGVEQQQAHEVSDEDARAEGTTGLADLQARWDSNPRWPRWASNPRLRVIRFESIDPAPLRGAFGG